MSEQLKDSYNISNETTFYLDLWFAVVTTTCLAVSSVVLNMINMAVFLKQGLKDRVYFTLFCLSLVDFMGATSLVAVCEGFNDAVWPQGINADRLSYIYSFNWVRNMFSDAATAVTVYVSIERSLCVARPFYFQSSYISRKPKIIIVCLIAFVCINYIPILACIRFVPFQNVDNNLTVFILTYSEWYFSLQGYNDVIFGVILSAACLICAFFCAVVMYRGLKISGEVRKLSHTNHKDSVNGLSKRDRDIVRMILVLSSLYMVSSLPQILHCWTRAILPELSSDRTMKLNRIAGEVVIFMSATYGAFSFVIYFRFNKKYRQTLCQIILA